MQNALQNPHYKKIWEKVIMNKHPEAKSLEEALEAESKECFCLFDDGVNSCEIHLMNTIKEHTFRQDKYEIITVYKIRFYYEESSLFLKMPSKEQAIKASNKIIDFLQNDEKILDLTN
jgi:hypothetical protein